MATILANVTRWIDEHHRLGAKQIGVSCNPIRRELYVTADGYREIYKCHSRQETAMFKEILHEHIARLQKVEV